MQGKYLIVATQAEAVTLCAALDAAFGYPRKGFDAYTRPSELADGRWSVKICPDVYDPSNKFYNPRAAAALGDSAKASLSASQPLTLRALTAETLDAQMDIISLN